MRFFFHLRRYPVAFCQELGWFSICLILFTCESFLPWLFCLLWLLRWRLNTLVHKHRNGIVLWASCDDSSLGGIGICYSESSYHIGRCRDLQHRVCVLSVSNSFNHGLLTGCACYHVFISVGTLVHQLRLLKVWRVGWRIYRIAITRTQLILLIRCFVLRVSLVDSQEHILVRLAQLGLATQDWRAISFLGRRQPWWRTAFSDFCLRMRKDELVFRLY